MVDLFAGPGGLDVAAGWLGIRVMGIEWDPNALLTRDAAGLGIADTCDVTDEANKPSAKEFRGAKILAGGPPCQTFTVAGGGAGRRELENLLDLVARMGDPTASRERIEAAVENLDDPRTGLVLQPLKWALEALQDQFPYQAIVLEQVPAVLPIWAAMAKVLQANGYFTDHGVLRTEEFGVPQTRRRAILIARRGVQPHLPAPTHQRYVKGKRPLEDGCLLPWISMEDALGDERGRFEVVSNYGTGGDPKARGRRRHDEPAFTVTGKIRRNRLEGGKVVPGVNDRFTEIEAGQLQTFPNLFPWRGSDIGQQIGNAIPPRLAAHVLAAALGVRLDLSKLDLAVRSEWDESKKIHDIALDRIDVLDDPAPDPEGLAGKPVFAFS